MCRCLRGMMMKDAGVMLIDDGVTTMIGGVTMMIEGDAMRMIDGGAMTKSGTTATGGQQSTR